MAHAGRALLGWRSGTQVFETQGDPDPRLSASRVVSSAIRAASLSRARLRFTPKVATEVWRSLLIPVFPERPPSFLSRHRRLWSVVKPSSLAEDPRRFVAHQVSQSTELGEAP